MNKWQNYFSLLDAKAEILGPFDKYIQMGSDLILQCNIRQSTELPVYLFWYHNNHMINYDVDPRKYVKTDLKSRSSLLIIKNTESIHEGNYTCVPNNAQPTSSYVHILNGKCMN